MRSENALAANFFDVVGANGGAAGSSSFGFEKFEGQEGGVAFVHVITRQRIVAEGAKHAHATDTQNYFLTQAIVRIAAVEAASERAIHVGVGGQVGVQKINGDFKSANADGVVAPAAQ